MLIYDVAQYLQQQRKQVIDKIIATLKALRERGLGFDRENLMFEIMQGTGCTRRKAMEYISEAEWAMNYQEQLDKKAAEALELG